MLEGVSIVDMLVDCSNAENSKLFFKWPECCNEKGDWWEQQVGIYATNKGHAGGRVKFANYEAKIHTEMTGGQTGCIEAEV